MLKPEVLVESKFARDDCLTVVDDARAQDVLSKAKALLWASWQESAIATTEQVAEFYEVPVKTVQTSAKTNRNEFESDGLKVLRGKDLKDVTLNIEVTYKVTSKASSLMIWTPRATLRLGMLLRDSEVAIAVRTLILDLTEATGKLVTQSEALAPAATEVIQEVTELKAKMTELDQRVQHIQHNGKQRFWVKTRDEALVYYSEECVDSFKSDLGGYLIDLKLVESQKETPVMLPPIPTKPEPVKDYNLNTKEDMKEWAEKFYKERGVNWG